MPLGCALPTPIISKAGAVKGARSPARLVAITPEWIVVWLRSPLILAPQPFLIIHTRFFALVNLVSESITNRCLPGTMHVIQHFAVHALLAQIYCLRRA